MIGFDEKKVRNFLRRLGVHVKHDVGVRTNKKKGKGKPRVCQIFGPL